MNADADRQVGLDRRHPLLQGLAEFQQVAAGGHGDGKADGGLAVEPEQHLRRVLIAAGNVGHVAQAEEALVDAQIHAAQTVLRRELAADAHRDALRPRLDHARW